MPRKIARIGINKSSGYAKGYAYFVDKDGDVSCFDTSGKRRKTEKVSKVGVKKCKGYIYFIDEDGDISSEEILKISPGLFSNKEEYEKVLKLAERELLEKLREEERNKLRIDRLRQKVKQEILEKEFQDIPEDERIRFISDDVKEFVWRRDQGKCVKCGSSEKLEFDHIIPFSKGGSNTARNIQLLCEKCNRSKHDNI